ncbi:MAG: hypothetical protein H6907_10480 [Hyphomicrobiales bacterium]|nr:hypothetical protein [Hyphomicrobiales bacterium]
MDATHAWIVILVHQVLFLGAFAVKNAVLQRRLGRPIRGNNPEAVAATAFFVLVIAAALAIAVLEPGFGRVAVLAEGLAWALGVLLLLAALVLAVAALLHLRDSWRVGVREDDGPNW